MFEFEKPIIYKAILHTLYNKEEIAQCASYEIDHDEELTYALLEGYIEKIMSSKQMKWAAFGENKDIEAVLEELDKDLTLFVEITRDLAGIMQAKIFKYQEYLPSCDIAFMLFEMQEVMYFAAVKLNHKDLYIRRTETSPGGRSNMITKSNDLYLTAKTNIEEGFIIHLKFMDIALLDKEYKVEGEKAGFFGDIVFKLDKGMSEKEKLRSFNQINKRLQEKFIGEDLNQKAQIKKAISDTLVEKGKLDVDYALDKAFEDGQEIKSIYKEALKRVNLEHEKIDVDHAAARKSFDYQKIVTDTGIEISIPVEYYQDSSKLEILSNDDGTITLVIKNIEEFSST